MRTPESTLSGRVPAAIALACLAAYAGTLGTKEFFHDDQAIIADNPLIHQGLKGLPRILSSGYWEAVQGSSAPVQEYRPLLMLTFLVQRISTGFAAAPMHALNLLLHIMVCLLLWRVLRRTMEPVAAAAGALVFCVMPIHTEAVSMLTGRSELLSAVFMLGSWLCLDGASDQKSLASGAALFFAALLCKESSLLLPVILAMSDWTFRRQTPWDPPRRRAHAILISCAAAYFCLRWTLLTRMIHGGVPYFTSGRLVAALSVSRFTLRHYLWPSLTGTGLCSDYSRPLIPDSVLSSWTSWACLLALGTAAAIALYCLIQKRSRWAFWLLGPALVLLPTSHIVIPLDTLGAERFLYIPTMGLAAGMGYLYARFEARSRLTAAALAGLLMGWYVLDSAWRNASWSSRIGFYEAAVQCNPVSARARSALGASLLSKGELEAGRANLLKAMELDPHSAGPYYNLARFAWERHDPAQAEGLLKKALQADPKAPDSWVLLAVVVESSGRLDEALDCLQRALTLWPLHSAAEYNLGRLYMIKRDSKEALRHFSRFLELAPDDPDARATALLVARLREEPGRP